MLAICWTASPLQGSRCSFAFNPRLSASHALPVQGCKRLLSPRAGDSFASVVNQDVIIERSFLYDLGRAGWCVGPHDSRRLLTRSGPGYPSAGAQLVFCSFSDPQLLILNLTLSATAAGQTSPAPGRLVPGAQGNWDTSTWL